MPPLPPPPQKKPWTMLIELGLVVLHGPHWATKLLAVLRKSAYLNIHKVVEHMV